MLTNRWSKSWDPFPLLLPLAAWSFLSLSFFVSVCISSFPCLIRARMAENKEPKTVIIGCGISGISAAHRLLKAGFHNVRILEATARSGGRIKTAKLEIGASYIHGPSEENPVFCLSRDYDLLDPEALTEENQANAVAERPPLVPNWFSSSGQRPIAEHMIPAVEMHVDLMEDLERIKNKEETPWASVGDFIRSELPQRAAERWKDKDETTRELLMCAISTLLKLECCDSAAHSMDDLDLAGFTLFKNLDGLDCTIPSGMEALIESLMSELPCDLVSYNHPVRCVHWNNEGDGEHAVMLECEDGERIAADHVIVTIPLGYLKKHHSTLFCPPLPVHKLHSLQKLGFGTCDKIFVEFDSPWWDPDCEVIYLLWTGKDDPSDQVFDIRKSWMHKIVGFTVHRPSERNSHVLCGWIAGQEAEYMETLSEEVVRRSVTELVHLFTRNPIITPRRILRTQWFHDPWTCGSYSHPAVGCTAQDLENLMEPLPSKGTQPLQVLFAGEATHPCHYSTVHGALLTGWREADRLISHYSSV
ncbi:peroxisomal N(1)-acetyl-spermine/spermidine oxidase-like isoform X2 [Platichthys flesus]|uniref:peroxisomal N(1)-acetyl-spermine/spermidine oxidase-like isoform X2 n=1 Tax=Platichthys flesus TaxID=8260 RepID=UPI002DB78DFF|nr:peroxisomal N(1)-acetyl-spermine/spermidine oxidase-like isoform X2 [Platichthys flesus]